ncbi:uncharacterized protein V6R79_020972 [Siganus canaliculatus]
MGNEMRSGCESHMTESADEIRQLGCFCSCLESLNAVWQLVRRTNEIPSVSSLFGFQSYWPHTTGNADPGFSAESQHPGGTLPEVALIAVCSRCFLMTSSRRCQLFLVLTLLSFVTERITSPSRGSKMSSYIMMLIVVSSLKAAICYEMFSVWCVLVTSSHSAETKQLKL